MDNKPLRVSNIKDIKAKVEAVALPADQQEKLMGLPAIKSIGDNLNLASDGTLSATGGGGGASVVDNLGYSKTEAISQAAATSLLYPTSGDTDFKNMVTAGNNLGDYRPNGVGMVVGTANTVQADSGNYSSALIYGYNNSNTGGEEGEVNIFGRNNVIAKSYDDIIFGTNNTITSASSGVWNQVVVGTSNTLTIPASNPTASAVIVGNANTLSTTGQIVIGTYNSTNSAEPDLIIGGDASNTADSSIVGGTDPNANARQTIVLGYQAEAKGFGNVLIGGGAKTGTNSTLQSVKMSVALGAHSRTNRNYEVSVGGSYYKSPSWNPFTRYIANVKAGELDTDAVNVKQMQDYVAAHGSTGGNDQRLTDTGAERANNLDANTITAISTTPQLTATTVGIDIAGKDLDTNGTLTATVTLPSATGTEAGVMSAADKTKLDSLSAITNLASVPTASYTADNVNLAFGDDNVELTPAVGTAGGANSKAGIMSAFQASQLAALAEAYKDTTQGITLYEGTASVNYIDLSDNAWNYDHIVVVGEYMSEGSASFHQSVSAEFYPNSADGINTFQINAIDIVANDTPVQTTLQDIWMLDEEGTELSLVAGMKSSIAGGATTTLTVEPESTSIFTITKVVGYGKKV